MQKDSLNISIANPHPKGTDLMQKLALAVAGAGVVVLLVAWGGYTFVNASFWLIFALGCIILGTVVYAFRLYSGVPAGIKNNGIWFNKLTNRGAWAWLAGIILTSFYCMLYWAPHLLGYNDDGNKGLTALFDPLSILFKGKPATQWFVYGTLYTILILSLGIKFIIKYRHVPYQRIRTIVVIISQLLLAYLIPEILEGLNSDAPYFAKDIKYMWPLNYYFFDGWHLDNMRNGGTLGMLYLVWGIVLFLVVTPFITYLVGKRWYCSWVCGCGGLAETAGDPWRQLSSKKMSSWKLERWMIHGVLVLVSIVTGVVLYGYFSGRGEIFGLSIYNYFSKPYGFLIGAAFSGVVGVGFYPVLGSRVWCRFGCPLAGYMGLFQRFKSRFRITTNGGQCISCGNCSTYCEQGIDVRAYAQKGQNIVRASCVGCGVCSSVCPRGVLKLENGPEHARITDNPIIIGKEGSIKLNM